MRSSPSIVPADRLDRDMVLEDFGVRAGCAWRETDEADTDLEGILQNLLSGWYAYPVSGFLFGLFTLASVSRNLPRVSEYECMLR
ncbi:hypothetical protein JEY40_33735 [Bradyrhizobium japonicum]|uniref:Uncharacterized protein n=1 Tax=Bradyrhizobium japonicum TaxID=375 RepID=A0A0A3XZ22_BRAJP|nr:hypothetical protein [Bradyrhizobium japonicum]KGT79702.1 hypothetical protein MA20_10970 [Bradyrhizobium japonicum]MCW2220805.1 hypothetical protein [Bradyrhizobium japonicum]MCW2345419.1 hypothetical protein [Bradyrhizobium japonicum]UQD77646.1 hypothetical protein JEY40_33735 [Bradyrhizobium japonicum]